MRLHQVLRAVPGARVTGSTDVLITGVTQDSRAVTQGSLFAAVPGATAKSVHGRAYLPTALAAGAAAVLCGEELACGTATRVVVDDVAAAVARAAEAFHGFPSRALRLLGVTGTNGKTTTAHVLEAMAAAAGEGTGFIGTTAFRVLREERKATHTTPPAEALSALLAEMVGRGVRTCAMEVSSHAMEQRRAEGLTLAGAVFTNLTQDHLDFHGTMERYFEAKARLFTELLSPAAARVLNADDERVASLRGRCGGVCLSFSVEGRPAEVRVTRRGVEGGLTVVEVTSPWGPLTLHTPLVGTYNVANVLGAATLHLATGTPAEAVVAGARSLAAVPGRLEGVPHPRGAHVLVDYAHTPDALARALQAVRPWVAPHGRLLCVLGCGGDRDPGKRPLMGETAAQWADVVVVTTDNPRSEDPQAIADAVVSGVARVGRAAVGPALEGRGLHLELDRARAIRAAVRAARAGDVVLVAGKGHEREQVLADRVIPFDDRDVAARAFDVEEEA
jgi:UDP-N-acetylmuramoyl-L-alanyl-D-glutamate--2,6-diaminopimelate ligase